MTKKRVILLTLMVVLVCFATEAVAKLYIAHGSVSLSFDGSQAICAAWYTANSTSDALDVTLSLYRGNTLVASWNKTGTGSTSLSKRCTVQSGKTYTLVMQCSINGVAQPTLSTTKTCP